MATLPRYQKAGVQLQQMRELDQSGFREVAKMGQTISEVVGRMSDFAYKKQAAKAARRGEQAIMDQGAQTVLNRIAERGGPSTIADQAAYALGSRVAAAEVQTEAEVEIARILDNAQKNKTPFTQVQALIGDIADGYSASMSGIDPAIAAVLRQDISSTGAKSAQRYASWYDAQMVAAAQARRTDNVSTLRASALTQAGSTDLGVQMTPNGPIDPMADLVSDFESQLSRMNYSDSQIEAEVSAMQKEIYRDQTVFQFYQTGDVNRKRDIVAGLLEKPLPGYTYEQTVSLASKLENDVNSLITVKQREITSLLGNLETAAMATGEAPQIPEDDIRNFFPADEAEQIIVEAKDALDWAVTVAGVSTSSEERLNILAEDLTASIVADPANATAYAKKLESLSKARVARDNAIKEDAAGYILSNDSILRRNFENAQQYPNSAPYYIESMNVAYEAMGVQPGLRNYLPKPTASAIVAQLNSMPLEEAPMALGMILGTYGDDAQKISAELSKAGLAPEYSVAMRYPDNPSLMAEIVASKAITLDDLKSGRSSNDTIADKEMMNSISDLSRPYRGALTDGDLTGAANRSFAESYAIAEKIARLRLINNNGDPLAVAQSVFVQMFPHQVVKTIGGGLGQNYLLPQDIDGRMAENALRKMTTPDSLRAAIQPLDDPRYRSVIDVELDIIDLSTSGVWINNSTGDGVVLTYRFRDQIPLPVTKPDGSYYEVKFADMQTISPALDAGVLEQRQIDLMSPGGSAPTIEQQYQQYLTPSSETLNPTASQNNPEIMNAVEDLGLRESLSTNVPDISVVDLNQMEISDLFSDSMSDNSELVWRDWGYGKATYVLDSKSKNVVFISNQDKIPLGKSAEEMAKKGKNFLTFIKDEASPSSNGGTKRTEAFKLLPEEMQKYSRTKRILAAKYAVKIIDEILGGEQWQK
jgi:hypothetical protein